jgi:hypothetical protein
VTNKTVFLIFLFMSFFLAIIIVGAIMSGEEFQQPGSPTPPQDEEAKGSKTIPLQTASRAEPLDGQTGYPVETTKPATKSGEIQDTEHASGKGQPQATVTPGETNIRLPQNNIEPHFTTMNEVILDILVGMPKGGGYDASPNGTSLQVLSSAIRLEANRLVIEPEKAKPSFCSSATYLVFLSALDRLNREGHLTISPQVMEKLLVTGQRDGVGAWGRWNANGPGTARLFEELHLGRNFTSFEQARPGDFMKIFWDDNIGVTETGHSVIYLGRGYPIENGDETILIWSSNKPDGYGRKEIPVTKIKRAVFSRLEDPRKIEGLLTLSKKDPYLAELERRPSTVNEMLQKIAIPPEVKPKPTQATPISESPKSNRENEGANQVNGTSDRLAPTPSLSQEEKAPKDTHNPQRVLPPKDQDDPGATPHPGDDH